MKKQCLLILFILVITRVHAQNSAEWKTTIGTLEEKEYLGRKAFFLNKGLAYLPASQFTDGVIEVDMATTLMSGLAFRIDANHNYEEAYIRYPKSGYTDALQFGSVFNGEFSWQFFPEYQAKVVYPADQWIHMKIIVEGDKAGIYLLNQDTAVLYIDSLRTGNKQGHIGVWALNGAYFSNLNYRKATGEEKLPAITKKLLYNPDAIKKWWISGPVAFTEPPSDGVQTSVASLKLEETISDPDGYLNINRYAKKKIWGSSRNNSNDMVWLRYEWDENADGLKPFSFEYSNMCFIYFNDHKIFAGNNSFLLKGPFYRGDIDKQMKANTVFLPVKKGKNNLLVAVSGVTNGWGFMGQFADGTKKKFGTF
ncbi:MAG: hypothetical protein ABIT05_06675 [Chitinophagaceae bacterium]